MSCRLQICMPHMGLDYESNSGGDVSDRELMIHMARLGANLHVPLFGQRENKIKEPNTYFYENRIKSTYGTGTFIPNTVYFRNILDLKKNGKVDILRLYSQDYGYCGFFTKALLGIPIVWNYYHLEQGFNERWQSFLFAKQFNAITTISESTKRELIAVYGLSKERVHVIYCGVSGFYRPKQINNDSYVKIPAGSKVLLHVGALIPRKNILFLIDVLRDIIREEPNTVLVLVGSEFSPRMGYTTLLKEKIAMLELERHVLFVGKISETEKLDWYNRCDVFVFPSLKEGFGFAPAEAMACAKPVVCSNTWSLPEIVINDITGFTASPTDVNEFSSRIIQLLRSSDLRQKFGRAGQARIREHFQWETAAKKTLELYEDIIMQNKKTKDAY